MSISFDRALGIHEKALGARVQRAEILANNLVNADTPGFKARDIDFRAALSGAQDDVLRLSQTSGQHIPASGAGADGDLLYRNPLQPSIDGNTVDSQVELAQYTRNAMDYQSSFQFLNSKFKGLVSAIKGE